MNRRIFFVLTRFRPRILARKEAQEDYEEERLLLERLDLYDLERLRLRECSQATEWCLKFRDRSDIS